MNKIQADIIVVGAGSAGLAAATSAARLGKSVILIEEDSQIGGAAIDYRVQRFDGRPYHGIQIELNREISDFDPHYIDDEEDYEHCFTTGAYLLAWRKMMKDLPITILINEKLINVNTCFDNEVQKITSIESTNYHITGEVFIDCTGTAALACQTACEIRYGREASYEYNEPDFVAPEKPDDKVQQCTLLYAVKRIDNTVKVKNKANWAFLNEDEFLVWGPTYECKDTRVETELAQISDFAYKKLIDVSKIWLERGFFISDIAPKIGLRESRRIVGNYTISYTDMFDKKEYDDSICVGYHLIDAWQKGIQEIDGNLRNPPLYEIPYRCLVTSKVNNMIVSGRCISGTHAAMSSYRVMGITVVLGQIAGIAASIAIETQKNTFDIDITNLRETAKSQGVIVDRKDGYLPKYVGGEGKPH